MSFLNQIVELYEFWRLYFLKMWLKNEKYFQQLSVILKHVFYYFWILVSFWRWLARWHSVTVCGWWRSQTRPLAPPPHIIPTWHGVRVRPRVHLFPRVQLLHGSWRPRLERRERCSIFWSHGLPTETGWKAQHPQWEREWGADTDELHQEGEE